MLDKVMMIVLLHRCENKINLMKDKKGNDARKQGDELWLETT
jgi:hypothetical protein